MTLAAQSKQFWPVLLGSSLALVSSSLLAVLFGAAIVQVVPARLIHIGSGIAFIAIGALLLSGRL